MNTRSFTGMVFFLAMAIYAALGFQPWSVPTRARLIYRGAAAAYRVADRHLATVSAILVYFVDGPNLISYALAAIGVMPPVLKAGLEQVQR